MKRTNASTALLLAGASMLGGCRAVGGIFKAGAWTGVVIALILVAIVAGAFAMLRGRT